MTYSPPVVIALLALPWAAMTSAMTVSTTAAQGWHRASTCCGGAVLEPTCVAGFLNNILSLPYLAVWKGCTTK